MIKRLFKIARSNINHWRKNKKGDSPLNELDFVFSGIGIDQETQIQVEPMSSSLVKYYANLEVPPGSSREEVKFAWKKLMKKYHPDLHSTDPIKRKTATELTLRLTEAYKAIDKVLKS